MGTSQKTNGCPSFPRERIMGTPRNNNGYPLLQRENHGYPLEIMKDTEDFPKRKWVDLPEITMGTHYPAKRRMGIPSEMLMGTNYSPDALMGTPPLK